MDMKGVLTGVAVLQTQMNVFRWLGPFVAVSLVTLLGGSLWVAWHASAAVSEIRQQGGRLDKIEQQLGQLIERIDQGRAKP